MDTWVWIVIALAALLGLALAVVMTRRSRERQLEERRGEANALRRKAEDRLTRAAERERTVDEESAQARQEREEAEALRRAAEERAVRAEEREATVGEEAARAHSERAAGEAAVQRAREVDPDADDVAGEHEVQAGEPARDTENEISWQEPGAGERVDPDQADDRRPGARRME